MIRPVPALYPPCVLERYRRHTARLRLLIKVLKLAVMALQRSIPVPVINSKTADSALPRIHRQCSFVAFSGLSCPNPQKPLKVVILLIIQESRRNLREKSNITNSPAKTGRASQRLYWSSLIRTGSSRNVQEWRKLLKPV